MTLSDASNGRDEGDPFEYKPARKLDAADPNLAKRTHRCGMYNMNRSETARMLGVDRTYLARFWEQHPEFEEAWLAGKEIRTARMRMLGDRHAVTDPATWRFMAKNELGMSDDPSKARADEAAAGLIHQQIDRGEIDKRIMELQAKVLGRDMKVIEHEQDQRAPVRPGAVHGPERGELRSAGAGAEHVPATEAQAPRRQDAPAAQGAVPEGLAQPQADGGGQAAALKGIAERMARLEASAVRKHPRKDGAPHTDRTVAKVTNTGDEAEDHAPPKLPGRIERKR